jgi:hypothetical protein
MKDAVNTARGSGMKVTTVRFGRDLWELLESESELVGTSVSQYIREAALARAAASAGSRGQSPFELLADAARGLSAEATGEQKRELDRAIALIERARAARDGSRSAKDESHAVQAQAEGARTQASTRQRRISESLESS